MVQRRTFSRAFKLEALKLVLERGVSAALVARDVLEKAGATFATQREPDHMAAKLFGDGAIHAWHAPTS